MATLYAVLIGVMGISMTVMAETTFLQEAVHPAFAPDWLFALRQFSLTEICGVLREFFPHALQLLIICDCMNRYILICLPEKKETFLSKKAITLAILVTVAVSSLFAGLTVKISQDIEVKYIGRPASPFNEGFQRRYTWVYFVVLKVMVSSMTAIFHVVFSVRIRIDLEKSIAFLSLNMNGAKGIARYRKIIRFSVYLCLIVVFFNIGVTGLEAAVLIRRHIHSNYLVDHSFLQNLLVDKVMNVMEYWINIVICFQPFCYASAHIWLKHH